MALGLNILVRYAGLVSIGHAGFVAIGIYATIILSIRFNLNFFVALLATIIITGIVGIIMRLPTLRVTGTYLTIVTSGFGEIVRSVIIWDSVTNGPLGIRNIPNPSIFGYELTIYNGGSYI